MKRKIRIGQLISAIGSFLTGIGLILNGFELVPVPVFRVIVLAGVLLQAVALIVILTRKEL